MTTIHYTPVYNLFILMCPYVSTYCICYSVTIHKKLWALWWWSSDRLVLYIPEILFYDRTCSSQSPTHIKPPDKKHVLQILLYLHHTRCHFTYTSLCPIMCLCYVSHNILQRLNNKMSSWQTVKCETDRNGIEQLKYNTKPHNNRRSGSITSEQDVIETQHVDEGKSQCNKTKQ